ncbi:MAG: hypothetical protein H7Y18_11330 [Clostridiaceae bacterium]|nr:hypothetical protein [Clostridiaceae bacterium]
MYKFYLVNFIISIVIYLYEKKVRKKDAIIGFLIMIFLPFCGVIFYIVMVVCEKYIVEFDNKHFKLWFDNDFKQESLIRRSGDLKNAMDIIPIEEALVLNDESVKRRLIINAIKGDSYQYLGFLKKALKDKDTETSHYAATAVTEVKRKLTMALQEFEVKYQQDDSNMEVLTTYVGILKKYNESGLLDKKAYIKNQYKYREILIRILSMDKTNEFYFEEIIKCDITLRKFNEAISYCENYMEIFINSETPYLLLLQIGYINKNVNQFNRIMLKLRSSQVKLSSNGIKILRFWLEGEE